MQTDPLSPEAGSSICSSLVPVRRGSGDNLWLPGLAGHLGVTLSDDRRAHRGLTVQAEATDHVLQSCAFRFPLLQREREKDGIHFCQSVLESTWICSHALPGLNYSLLINDVYQHRRFMLAVSSAPG